MHVSIVCNRKILSLVSLFPRRCNSDRCSKFSWSLTYLDNILESVDPVIKLDEEQRKVVLSDEDYTLVIAGAGAGKTTTVAAKVKYLVEKKGVNLRCLLRKSSLCFDIKDGDLCKSSIS